LLKLYSYPTPFLQFAPDVKIYSYFQLYTSDNLLADIGGYLGLFLGLSVYSLFEVIEAILERLEKREDNKMKSKNDVEMAGKFSR
jgi:hypothetical protein